MPKPEISDRRPQEQLERFDDYNRSLESGVREMLMHEQAANRKLRELVHVGVNRAFGFGNEQRERDVARLRLALTRKRARMMPDNEGKWRGTDFDQWKDDLLEIPFAARRIASQFNCPVRDSVKYWLAHLEEKRQREEQEIAKLKECGLLKNGETGWREFHRPTGALAYFHVKMPQTPAQITAECERIKELWPDKQDWPSEDWETAEQEIKDAWENELCMRQPWS